MPDPHQRVKRYTLDLNGGPQDFLMGRIIHIGPAGHHPDQTDITKLWIWALERTGTNPLHVSTKKLQAFQDNEQAIPYSARYIASIIVPFRSPTVDALDMMSPSFVWHLFRMMPDDSDPVNYHIAGRAMDTSNPNPNVIQQILDTPDEHALVPNRIAS